MHRQTTRWITAAGSCLALSAAGCAAALAAGEVPERIGARLLSAAGLATVTPQKNGSDDGPDFGDDNGGDRGGGESDDLGGAWNATVSFSGNPGLDHSANWTFSPLFDDVYTLTARRASDGAQQSGVGVELSHSRPDIGLYGSFDDASCRYILVGDAETFNFSGIAIYKCADGFAATGSFSATR